MVTPGGPEDGGDFGSETTNTKNSGIQDALDCAKGNKKMSTSLAAESLKLSRTGWIIGRMKCCPLGIKTDG